MKEIYEQTTKGPWTTEESTDTQYRITETDDLITIDFQGSCSGLDWLQNFSFWKKPYKNMPKVFFVHAGFLKKYKAVRDVIHGVCRKSPGKDVMIRGYSQGAALAQLCYEDIWFNFPASMAKGIGFGTPRVFGIWNFRALNDRLEKFLRVENGNDIVCHLPPWLFLYKHYGTKKHVGSKRHWWKYSIKDHLTYEENL